MPPPAKKDKEAAFMLQSDSVALYEPLVTKGVLLLFLQYVRN